MSKRRPEPFPQAFPVVFPGVLLRQAEGERKHHAEPEAGGHPEGLRQTVSAFNRPITRLTELTRHPSSRRCPLIFLLIFHSVLCLRSASPGNGSTKQW